MGPSALNKTVSAAGLFSLGNYKVIRSKKKEKQGRCTIVCRAQVGTSYMILKYEIYRVLIWTYIYRYSLLTLEEVN